MKNYITLVLIGFIWGSQFIFQHIALKAFSPEWVGASRALIGSITLVIICRLMRLKGNSTQWKLFALIGLLEAVIPFVLIPWGQQKLASSITAILIGTLPFYAILLAPLVIDGAKITAGSFIGCRILRRVYLIYV